MEHIGKAMEAFKIGERSTKSPDYVSFIQFSDIVSGHIIGKVETLRGHLRSLYQVGAIVTVHFKERKFAVWKIGLNWEKK